MGIDDIVDRIQAPSGECVHVFDQPRCGDDLIDVASLQLAFAEGVIGLDVMVSVEHDRHISLLGHAIAAGTRWIVERENQLFELFFLGERFELAFHIFVIAKEDDEAAHAATAVLDGGGIDLLFPVRLALPVT